MRSVAEIQEIERSGKTLDFLFFWGHQTSKKTIGKQCLSQWFPCSFIVDGVAYNSAEQFMMAKKADLFNDTETFHEIIKERDMKQIKELGRRIRGFSDEVWNQEKFNAVVRGNFAKFSQNRELGTYLTETVPKILVEASPYDKVWGVGLSENDQKIFRSSNWDGLNLLGFALMEVRDALIQSGNTKKIL